MSPSADLNIPFTPLFVCKGGFSWLVLKSSKMLHLSFGAQWTKLRKQGSPENIYVCVLIKVKVLDSSG